MNSRRLNWAVFGGMAVLACVVLAGALRLGLANLVTGVALSEDTPRAARLFRALSEAGAEVTETDVTVTLTDGRGSVTAGELRGAVQRAAVKLGLSPADDDVVEVDEGEARSVTVGPLRAGGVEFLLGAQSGAVRFPGRRSLTTFSIKARSSGFVSEADGLAGRLRSVATAAAPRQLTEQQVRTFVTMRAVLPGDRKDRAAAKAREVVRLLGGRNVRSTGGAGWKSLSAYADGLGEPVRFSGHTMNLNVAWHEDERLRRFYLVVGTPLITEDY